MNNTSSYLKLAEVAAATALEGNLKEMEVGARLAQAYATMALAAATRDAGPLR